MFTNPDDKKLIQKSMWMQVKLQRVQRILNGEEIDVTGSDDWMSFFDQVTSINWRLDGSSDLVQRMVKSDEFKLEHYKPLADVIKEEDKLIAVLAAISLSDSDVTELIANLEKTRRNLEDSINKHIQEVIQEEPHKELCHLLRVNMDSNSNSDSMSSFLHSDEDDETPELVSNCHLRTTLFADENANRKEQEKKCKSCATPFHCAFHVVKK